MRFFVLCFLFVALTSRPLFAQCVKAPEPIRHLNTLTKKLASCSEEKKISRLAQEMERIFTSSQVNSKKISGISLTDQAEKIEILDRMLIGFPREELAKAKSCVSAECVIEKITNSREVALRSLNIAQRTGYVLSFRQENSDGPYSQLSIWTADEARTIDLALKKLPDSFFHLKGMEGFRRAPVDAPSTKTFCGHAQAVIAAHSVAPFLWVDGYIATHPVMFKGNPMQTLVHEMGHQYDRLKGQPTFGKEHLFADLGSTPTSDGPVNREQISEYSKIDFDEDFAENIKYYVFSPAIAKKRAPTKYQFLKENVFQGKEFLNTKEDDPCD